MKGRKLSDREIERHEAKRDVWREVLDGIDEIKTGGGKRYVVAPKTEVAKARIKAGLSQSQFAALMGVSKRTLEQWEQGRREPSGAAKTLIRIADLRPEVLKEITV
jgi:putative transcriptional regulator